MKGMKEEQLVEEFHVQVYSNGRVDWDRLDRYVTQINLRTDVVKRDLANKFKQLFADPRKKSAA